MALRKPLVIGPSGKPQELQAGDVIDGPVAEVDVITASNSNAGPITLGQPVYVDGSGSVDLAQANAAATSDVIGLVAEASIAAAATGSIQTNGAITSSDWTAVTGAVTLSAGAPYFLDAAAPGMLTTSPPTGNPNSVTCVGIATSTDTFQIRIEPAILRG